MQKAPLRQPTTTLHQLLVQDGNLPGRPTKTDEAELEPKPKGGGHAHGGGSNLCSLGHVRAGRMCSGFGLEACGI